jgi:hypothetical protein
VNDNTRRFVKRQSIRLPAIKKNGCETDVIMQDMPPKAMADPAISGDNWRPEHINARFPSRDLRFPTPLQQPNTAQVDRRPNETSIILAPTTDVGTEFSRGRFHCHNAGGRGGSAPRLVERALTETHAQNLVHMRLSYSRGLKKRADSTGQCVFAAQELDRDLHPLV